jgi:dipeptidyl aminopeptidase/acylaminoacyl peptidase
VKAPRPYSIVPLLALVATALPNGPSLSNYKPSLAALRESYRRADQIGRDYNAKAFKLRLEPNWMEGGKRFWYRNELPASKREFILVDTATGSRAPAFDHAKLAEALRKAGRTAEADALPFREIHFIEDGKMLSFDIGNQGWKCDLATYALQQVDPRMRPRQQNRPPWRQSLWEPSRTPVDSPDVSFTARIVEHNVMVKPKDGEEFQLSKAGTAGAYFARLSWSRDSKRLIGIRVIPGDRKQVHLLESSPREWGPATLASRIYDRPGDKLDSFDIWILDPVAKTEKLIEAEPLDYGGLPGLRWRKDGTRFTYEKMDRGYGRWRIVEVDSVTGKSRAIVDDDPATFFDSTNQYTYYCRESEDVIWRSERDGWGHLYLADGEGGIRNQITKGLWVVRSVQSVDEKARQIVFAASGMDAKEDPYFIHYYRINFDGTGLKSLTPALGNHTVAFSPDGKTLIDTYSTVQNAPVHELRNAEDGRLLVTLERGDITQLKGSGWRAPEPFVAKGRDGKTDIYGVVYWPSHFDKNKRYPVIEDIYAGPQDSFVPKSFSPAHGGQGLAELGFIVVKIDGMGTRNRGKAFHDICYKNLADAGFPDRILWMKALAKRYPNLDLDRVGIYGGSAGGQNSAGALLFHPDFYKVAVSSCGCHDNRLDKVWWNEQWMGVMGPHYAAQSNITNASKLRGRLLLLVGELDDNVPPESTYRLADALMKADREFELVLLTGQGHTGGGKYGERKRRDFFVRHLLGVEPPDWNGSWLNVDFVLSFRRFLGSKGCGGRFKQCR